MKSLMSHSPITATEAKALFAPWQNAPALIVAVSGGPDSVALLWLLARWRRALKDAPSLIAVTVDHGLRPESAREAREVKRLAASLGIPHVAKRWRGAKPNTGIPAAARAARYGLLEQVAQKYKARHIVTAHTQDDQAETLLMRLVRGSGVAGLKAMTQETARQTACGDIVLVRPLLGMPKARLIATLRRANIPFADDPTNRDQAFTRPRLRAMLPALAAEGLTAESLSRLAIRMQRADAALDHATAAAMQRLALAGSAGFDAALFAALPAEIRLRLLRKSICAVGRENQADLAQAEALLAAIDAAPQRTQNGVRLRQTLAGALVTLTATRLAIAAAPARRIARKPSSP